MIMYEKNCKDEKRWDDSVSILIYDTEYTKQRDKPLATALKASKKVILRKISEISGSLEEEVILLIENIIQLERIILILHPEKAYLKVGTTDISLWLAPKQFFKILIETCKENPTYIDKKFDENY